MRKNKKRKSQLASFEGLDKDLEKLQSKQKDELSKLEKRFNLRKSELVFIIFLLFLTTASIVTFYIVSWNADHGRVDDSQGARNTASDEKSEETQESSQELSQTNSSSSSQELTKEQEKLKKEIVVAPGKAAEFKWNVANFKDLQVRNRTLNISGATLDEVIKKFGKASNVNFLGEFVYLDYNVKLHDLKKYGSIGLEQSIHLSFYKYGSIYHLTEKQALSLPDSHYPAAIADEFVFKWKQDDVDSLIVGDEKTGQGGMSYQEIVDRFGLPKYVTFLGKDSDTHPLVLKAIYSSKIGGNEALRGSVVLNFIEQYDGVYRLSKHVSIIVDQ